jgi:CubicO group peptidase (beta-lactamase class C family)
MFLEDGTAEQAGLKPDRLQAIRQRAASWVTDGKTPSLVVLAARRGVIALHEAFGTLTHEPDSPALAIDSVFPVSSVSKPITATAIMLLVEDGVLGLSRPVVDYIPELTGKGADDILVHQLLNHTSGFEDVAAFALTTERLKNRIDLGDLAPNQHKRNELLLRARYGLDLGFPPGTEHCYCTFNYDLLGEIVRRLSGLGLDEFARARIFEPLGMIDASYRMEERYVGRLVKRGPGVPFGPAPEEMIGRGAVDLNDERVLDVPFGGGGMAATARDLAIFGQLFLNGGRYGEFELLSRPTVEAMTRNQTQGLGTRFLGDWYPDASYGLGWFVQGIRPYRHMNGTLPAHGSFGHSGMGGARFWVDPVNEIVGVYLGICTEVDNDTGDQKTEFDLFQNLVTAAVSD